MSIGLHLIDLIGRHTTKKYTLHHTHTTNLKMSQQPYAITVEPDSALQFTITKDPTSDGDANSGSRCVMTLRHPGLTNSHLAFKVCLIKDIVF